MSHDSYICGFLKLRGSVADALAQIEKLPQDSESDTWPYLTSSMFSYTKSPEYRDFIIHFAASYKDICGSWAEWEAKFERLLRNIEFDEVKILIEDCYQGDFIVRWRSEHSAGTVSVTRIRRSLDYEDQLDIEFS